MNRTTMSLLSRFKGTFLGNWLRRYRWNKQLISIAGITKAVDQNTADTLTQKQKDELAADVLNMAKKYRFSAGEYFCYHFQDKTEDERKQFISDLNRIDLVESLNKPENLIIFDDKIRTYEVFGDYYGRKVVCVRSHRDMEALQQFALEQKRFIIKPLNGTCGMGVQIIDLSSEDAIDTKLSELIDQYCANGGMGFIAEQLIMQVPELARLHPASVNTIRIATIRYDDGPELLASFFRIGQGSNIVDNAGAGGIICTLDLSDGHVIAAADEYGKQYTVHPDTNIPLIGFTVPQWEEATALAKELATIVKGNRYAGWDLALTENGWVMVEGNARGQFVWQMPTQKGFWPEMNKVLKRLGRKEMSNHGI